jgi:hypothetical protein
MNPKEQREVHKAGLDYLSQSLGAHYEFGDFKHERASESTLKITLKKGFVIKKAVPFDKTLQQQLNSVYSQVKDNSRIDQRWGAHYQFSEKDSVLTIKIVAEHEQPKAGWSWILGRTGY